MTIRNYNIRDLPRPEPMVASNIGKSIDAMLPAGAVLLRQEQHQAPARTDELSWVREMYALPGSDRATISFERSYRPDDPKKTFVQSKLQITDPSNSEVTTYFAGANGRVESYAETSYVKGNAERPEMETGSTWYHDKLAFTDEADGRLSEVSMSRGHMPAIDPSAFSGALEARDPLHPERDNAIRSMSLIDSDGNGSFDKQSVGGWWINGEEK